MRTTVVAASGVVRTMLFGRRSLVIRALSGWIPGNRTRIGAVVSAWAGAGGPLRHRRYAGDRQNGGSAHQGPEGLHGLLLLEGNFTDWQYAGEPSVPCRDELFAN